MTHIKIPLSFDCLRCILFGYLITQFAWHVSQNAQRAQIKVRVDCTHCSIKETLVLIVMGVLTTTTTIRGGVFRWGHVKPRGWSRSSWWGRSVGIPGKRWRHCQGHCSTTGSSHWLVMIVHRGCHIQKRSVEEEAAVGGGYIWRGGNWSHWIRVV